MMRKKVGKELPAWGSFSSVKVGEGIGVAVISLGALVGVGVKVAGWGVAVAVGWITVGVGVVD